MPKRAKSKTALRTTSSSIPSDPPIDPLLRFEAFFLFLAKLFLAVFQNVVILAIGGILIILAIMYLFFTFFGLT